MHSVKILIVEDQVVTANQLELRLTQLGYLITDCAASGAEALASIRAKKPDIILMDVRIKGPIDGIQTTEKIKKEVDLPIIYLTAHDDRSTMLRAGATKPANFLTKPFSMKDVKVAIDFAILNSANDRSPKNSAYQVRDIIFVKKRDFYEKIVINEILWIEAQGNYLNIHIEKSRPYHLSMTLKKFSLQFSHPNLIRVNRSYIINRNKVSMIKGHQLVIKDKTITISDTYLPEIEQFWPIIRSN